MAEAIGTPRFRPKRRAANHRWLKVREVCGFTPTEAQANRFTWDMYTYINQFFGSERVHEVLEEVFPRDWTFHEIVIDWYDSQLGKDVPTPHWVLEHKTLREVDHQDENLERRLRKDSTTESPYGKAKHGARRTTKEGGVNYRTRAPTMPVRAQNTWEDTNDNMCQMYATHHYMYPDDPLITQKDVERLGTPDAVSTMKLLKLAETAERLVTSGQFQSAMHAPNPRHPDGSSAWVEFLGPARGSGTFIDERTDRPLKISVDEFINRQLATIDTWKEWGYRYYQGQGDYGTIEIARRLFARK